MTATPVMTYDTSSDGLMHGFVFSGLFTEVYLLHPCDPISGWRNIKLHERLNAEDQADDADLFESPEALGRVIDSAFEMLEVVTKEYPSVDDVISIWDGIPSVRIRTELASELRRALGEGDLVDESGEVLRRLKEFEVLHRTFAC